MTYLWYGFTFTPVSSESHLNFILYLEILPSEDVKSSMISETLKKTGHSRTKKLLQLKSDVKRVNNEFSISQDFMGRASLKICT